MLLSIKKTHFYSYKKYLFNNMRYPNSNVFLYFSAFTVNLLSVVMGAVFSWTSPAIPKLYSNDPSFNPLGRPITSSEESLLASMPNIGAIIGSITSGMISEHLGRKRTLVIYTLPFVVSHITFILARTINLYYACRLLLGLGAGAVLSVLPSYVGEISENSNRGALGSLLGIGSSLGHLTSFGIGPLVTIPTFSYIQLIPLTIFLLVFIPFVPESPHYYIAKNDDENAMKSLKKLRKNSDNSKELFYLKEIVNEKKGNKVNLKQLAASATRKGLLVSCGVLILQSFTGIPIILLYLQPILEASGNIIPSHLASLIIGLVQIVSCCFSGLLIDRLGRKVLLYISSIGCSVSLILLGTYFLLKDNNYNLDSIFWLPIATLINFYLHYNIGFGPIPWAICGELFASNIKSVCVSITGTVALSVAVSVASSFPFVRDIFGMSGVFFVFSALAASASIFVWLVVPETKGKSFQEIQNSLSGRKREIKS